MNIPEKSLYKIKYDNESGCVAQSEFAAKDAYFFAIATFFLLIAPTAWLSIIFLLDTRRMLKRVNKFGFGMKLLFWVGLLTCSGYLIKHLMLVIYGIKARKMAKKKDDVFDKEVQVLMYLHHHCQSHLEHFRRVEAVTKLVPQGR